MLIYSQISLTDLQRPEPTTYTLKGANVTLYAFDVQLRPDFYEDVMNTALLEAKDAALAFKPTMGSEALSYRIQSVSLVLIPTEALTPVCWLSAVIAMRHEGRRTGYWGCSFQICDTSTGNEIGSGRLKYVGLSTSHVLTSET